MEFFLYGYKIKFSGAEKAQNGDFMSKSSDKMYENIMLNLKMRFIDLRRLDSFDALHYSLHIVGSRSSPNQSIKDALQHSPPIRIQILMNEWDHFRLYFNYPNIALDEILPNPPVSTVECERTFPELKIIKTERDEKD